ncbi:MAG: DUF1800 domain-containing protein [Pseudomonadota bacterium]
MKDLRFPPNAEALPAYRASSAEYRKTKDPEKRLEARRALFRARRQVVAAFSQATLRRALNERDDIDEPLVWFWFNHFNVFWLKDLVGAALPDYVDGVIRPRMTGRFRDLLLGVMTHPAMLVYLDNSRNVAGRINENYARELLELHTLGVNGGYTQADVQEVARVLTGFGLRPLQPVRWTEKQAAQMREQGEFLFDPRRHDFGDKRVLGRTIAGAGYAELETLADMLSRQPATARHLCGKLCLFLVGEDAPRDMVEQAAKVYMDTDGDLAKVVADIRRQAGRLAVRPRTFKDPYRWVITSVSLLAASRPVDNTQPVERWLVALGEPLFGRSTPDGYSLRGSDWVGAGQLTQRFELARELVATAPRLLDGPLEVDRVLASGPARALQASLGPASRAALDKAEAGEDKLALLISSPEFMYW